MYSYLYLQPILLFTQSRLELPVFSTDDGPRAVYKGNNGIALTFNLAGGSTKAEPIIQLLEKNNVKEATFFLSGAWAERHPDLTKKIQELGFEIGILGYDYVNYSEVETGEIRKDIGKAQEVFTKLGVKEISLVRAPTGHFNKATIDTVDQLGFTLVHWSINSHDWTNPGVENIVHNVQHAANGDILLFHASDSAKQTKDALPVILKGLENKGEFVSVSDLINAGKVKTKLVP
ncbi:polysaccharide deacetylase family protein [Bacillus coahuilensis]|uniref:polysaccharide deacetylase family protein n=1 Tax=Bacillus coahuilensis TaxID=408580 RepID=UPI000B28214B|nr:polysaccharide deacetylase family protein [Bacillus coahuilensis]